MTSIFTNLSQNILEHVEEQLSNDDVSSNEEMIDFFITELGLSAQQAVAAVALRTQYLQAIFLIGQGPLHTASGQVFDPVTKSFR